MRLSNEPLGDLLWGGTLVIIGGFKQRDEGAPHQKVIRPGRSESLFLAGFHRRFRNDPQSPLQSWTKPPAEIVDHPLKFPVNGF